MQIAIVIVIDIETALKEGTLDQNAYVIHNTARYPSWGEGLHTRIPGVCNPDGSQAVEAVLNWIILGVSGPPTTLPRGYRHQLGARNDAKVLAAVRAARTPSTIAKTLTETEGAHHAPLMVRRADGGVRRQEGVIVDTQGRLVDPADADAVANSTPILADIRGDAVDKGVFYPALYGSPEPETEGWYWSAAVDTSKVGRHEYILDILLHEPKQTDKGVVWEGRTLPLHTMLDVTQSVAVNGFTGGFCTPFLDLSPKAPLQAGDAI